MKAKTIILFLLLVMARSAYSQDYIYTLETRTPIEAIVIEISDMDVLYKTFDNPEGANYRLPTERIRKIVFENGTERYFNSHNRSVNPYPTINPYLGYRWGGVYDGHRRLHSDELLDYFGYSEYGTKYLVAKRKVTWGMSLTAVGAAATVFGASVYLIGKDDKEFFKGSEFMSSNISNTDYILPLVAGVACLGVGIPIWISGDKQILRMLDTYNENRRDNRDVSLRLGLTSSGALGLCLNF